MTPAAFRRSGPLTQMLTFVLTVAILCSTPAQSQVASPAAQRGPTVVALSAPGRAPFGSAISEQRIPDYHRATYQIGTSGPLTRNGVGEAKRLGFVSILDLGSSPERSRAEQRMAEFANIGYLSLPIASLPTEQQIQQFANIVQDARDLPILVHGNDIDQIGVVWALYRVALGVPPEIAVVDGMTAGLDASLSTVRARLGLPDRQ